MVESSQIAKEKSRDIFADCEVFMPSIVKTQGGYAGETMKAKPLIKNATVSIGGGGANSPGKRAGLTRVTAIPLRLSTNGTGKSRKRCGGQGSNLHNGITVTGLTIPRVCQFHHRHTSPTSPHVGKFRLMIPVGVIGSIGDTRLNQTALTGDSIRNEPARLVKSNSPGVPVEASA